MKKQANKFYPLLALILGFAAAGCRAALYALGTDAKGLLVSGHPAAIALWVVTAAALVLAAAAWLRTREEDVCGESRNVPEALGTAVMALGVLSTMLFPEKGGIAVLMRIHGILSLLGFGGLLAAAGFLLAGKKPPFGCYAAAAVFLLVHVVARYRVWSSNPQLANYLFALGAGLCLTLVSYYQAALAVGLGGIRQRLALGSLGIFFCITAAVRGEYPVLHICSAGWLLSLLLTAKTGETEEAL